MRNRKKNKKSYVKPRLHWFKGKMVEKVSDKKAKNTNKKQRQEWKKQIRKYIKEET